MTTLTRRYSFSASHRLHSPALGEPENARLYGKCNNPFGHGHNYVLEVTVAGPLDPRSGLLVPIDHLDRLVTIVVLNHFAYRNINLDLPEFENLVPTAENIAVVIANLLQRNWHLVSEFPTGPGRRLHRVHLQETDRNGFEIILGSREMHSLLQRQDESVTVNG